MFVLFLLTFVLVSLPFHKSRCTCGIDNDMEAIDGVFDSSSRNSSEVGRSSHDDMSGSCDNI